MSVTTLLVLLAAICAFIAAISGWVDHPVLGRANLIAWALFFYFLSLILK